MPDFSFLEGGGDDDGTIRINTRAGRKTAAKRHAKTIVQSLEDAEKSLNGCANQLLGCGCLLMLLGALLGLPFILALR